MSKLTIGGTPYGDVLTSDHDGQYPCMDTNYRELTWTFVVDIEFDSHAEVINFEKNTLPSLFDSNRTHNVGYAGHTYNNCVIVSFKRNRVIGFVGEKCIAEYTVVFSKEDA